MFLSPPAKNISPSGISRSTLCSSLGLGDDLSGPPAPPHPIHCFCSFRHQLICHLLRKLSLISLTRSDLSVSSSPNTINLFFAAKQNLQIFTHFCDYLISICLPHYSVMVDQYTGSVGVRLIGSLCGFLWCKYNH